MEKPNFRHFTIYSTFENYGGESSFEVTRPSDRKMVGKTNLDNGKINDAEFPYSRIERISITSSIRFLGILRISVSQKILLEFSIDGFVSKDGSKTKLLNDPGIIVRSDDELQFSIHHVEWPSKIPKTIRVLAHGTKSQHLEHFKLIPIIS